MAQTFPKQDGQIQTRNDAPGVWTFCPKLFEAISRRQAAPRPKRKAALAHDVQDLDEIEPGQVIGVNMTGRSCSTNPGFPNMTDSPWRA